MLSSLNVLCVNYYGVILYACIIMYIVPCRKCYIKEDSVLLEELRTIGAVS